MDEEKDLEEQDSQDPANEDGDSQDTDQTSESDETPDKDAKIAKLEADNKQLFARAKKAEGKSHEAPKEEKPPAPITDVDLLVSQKFEERDLANLDLSDDVKDEVKAYAKAKDISVLEASKSEYVGFLKTQEESKAREQDASASTKGTSTTVKRDFSSLAEGDILNFSDEEMDGYKEYLKTQG